MKDNNKKRKKPLTMMLATRRMVAGQPAPASEEEEAMLTPFQMVVNNFLHDKVAVAGVIWFVLVFLGVIFLPIFLPLGK